jgi:hypothetical protein
MDGWEFLRRKGQEEKLVTIPVVVMSGTERRVPSNRMTSKDPAAPALARISWNRFGDEFHWLCGGMPVEIARWLIKCLLGA